MSDGLKRGMKVNGQGPRASRGKEKGSKKNIEKASFFRLLFVSLAWRAAGKEMQYKGKQLREKRRGRENKMIEIALSDWG